MSELLPLPEVVDTSVFGSKAVALGQAARDGLPVPPGVALSGALVEAVAGGDDPALERVVAAVRPLGGPLAVRSSAVDEDGAEASFAGQHLTLLNVPSADALELRCARSGGRRTPIRRSPTGSESGSSPAPASRSSCRCCSHPFAPA